MKLLHTSDWHLGKTLYGRRRTEEHTRFLDWLAETIKHEEIDLLCIAGDIFDSPNPSNRSQSLYYGFLQKIIADGCRDVIIIAGNHDSPTLLEAPIELLKSMHVHVVGRIEPNHPEKEIITIRNDAGEPELIACAVPYLRDKDVRTAHPGESIDDKSRNLIAGVNDHYTKIIALAEQIREAAKRPIPIVAMGHLFTAGGKTIEGDGVRDLYVGNLAHVPASSFPDSIDYLALGHLHSAQTVAHSNAFRYCGSPLPMSFAEAEKEKQLLLVTFAETTSTVRSIPVPKFQVLLSLDGDLPTILEKIEILKYNSAKAWLEIKYQGDDTADIVQQTLRKAIKDSRLVILRIINKTVLYNVLRAETDGETLEELTVDDVFTRCLDHHRISGDRRAEISHRFHRITAELDEYDVNAD